MDLGKQEASDTSSTDQEPYDHDNDDDQLVNCYSYNHDQEEEEDPKRCYECTFCKRGFTNAQALGGHMNIHRKDRARAKQSVHPLRHSSVLDHHHYPNTNMVNINQFEPAANTYYNYPVLEASNNQRNSYMAPTHERPADAYDHYRHAYSIRSTQATVNLNQETLGANLSLRVGSSSGVWRNDDVDLELRLGYN